MNSKPVFRCKKHKHNIIRKCNIKNNNNTKHTNHQRTRKEREETEPSASIDN